MGGFDGEKMTASLEVYDPRVGTWMVSSTINQERGYASAVMVGERIYVIGGVQSDEKILHVVSYIMHPASKNHFNPPASVIIGLIHLLLYFDRLSVMKKGRDGK